MSNGYLEEKKRRSPVEKDGTDHGAAETVQREELLGKLRAVGIESVSASYNGYGDSGNVEDIVLTPDRDLGLLDRELADFIWSFVYSLHPGFENNEGGQGEFGWTISTDRIDVSHGDNYTEIEVTEHEGI